MPQIIVDFFITVIIVNAIFTCWLVVNLVKVRKQVKKLKKHWRNE
jgi:hypothetical protein